MKNLSIGVILLSFATTACLAVPTMSRLGENLPQAKHKSAAINNGSKIEMKNVKFYNKTNVKNSAVAGNTGISIKAEKINMQNVKIESDSTVENSSINGNTGVSLGN